MLPKDRKSTKTAPPLPQSGRKPPLKLHARGRPVRRHVLIAGGGVAALEAMLALRHLSGDLLDIELLSPASDFHYRPLRTAEPFEGGRAPSYSLSELTRARSARHRLGSVTAVDPGSRAVQLSNGQSLDYDFLLLDGLSVCC